MDGYTIMKTDWVEVIFVGGLILVLLIISVGVVLGGTCS
jgi:hypothetical protein